MSKKILLLVVLVVGVVAIPVISIVGGALFAATQETCTQTTSGFSGSNIMVSDYEVNDQNQLVIEITNAAASNLEMESITVDGQTQQLSESIGIGSSASVTFDQGNVEISESCNEIPVGFTYNSGESVEGTFTGEIQVQ